MQPIQKLESLSLHLGLDLGDLVFLSNSADSLYSERIIKKRSGGNRIINPPKYKLKTVQRKILDRILKNEPISKFCFGWVENKSRVDAVIGHVHKKYVYTADVSEFFPSIHSRKIYKVFNQNLGFSPDVSRMLTRLTTYKNCLPQGAPTSPMLTNIIFMPLDNHLSKFWAVRSAYYSRFGDDMIVSSNKRIPDFEKTITQKIKSISLKTNPQKFKAMERGKRQILLGLVVNEKVNIPNEEITELKAILHKAKSTGLEAQNTEHHPHYPEHIAGRIIQIKVLNPPIGQRLLEMFMEVW